MPASVYGAGTVASPVAGWSADTAPGEVRAGVRWGPGPARGSRRGWFIVLLVLALLSGGGTAVFFAVSSVVEVQVDGKVLSARTFATEVGGVLDRLGVEVGDADRVTPPADVPVEDGLVIVVHRARTVEVVVDGDPPVTVVTTFDTVGEVLREVGFGDLLAREARIDPGPGEPIAAGGRIVVGLPVTVTIAVDGELLEFATYATRVGDALEAAGVKVGDRDLIEPPHDHPLERATDITVRRVEIVEEVVEVAIEHGELRRDTADLAEGESRVQTPGSDGLRRETYEVTVVDGDVTGRELITEEVVREPTDRVVLVGTASGTVREAQRLLAELGYPVGPVDGIDGAQTRRGLCAWRRLEGHEVSRATLRPRELESLRASNGLPAASSGRGVTIDRTCQVLYYRQDGQWRHVHHASTGADGLPREGSYAIGRTNAGWHTSSLYPAPAPNMYNSLYFHGAIAIHGANHVPPHPASSGCVRVTPQAADQLFAALRIDDPVRVIGSY